MDYWRNGPNDKWVDGDDSWIPDYGNISGLIAGNCVVTGALRIIKNISGIIVGSSVVTGSLKVLRKISGLVVGASLVTGVTIRVRNISGIIAGSSVVTGSLKVLRKISGLVVGASLVTGVTGCVRNISGTIASSSVVTGSLKVLRKISGLVVGASLVTGITTRIRNISGTVAGSSVVTGLVKVLRKISGIITGTSTVEGDLRISIPFPDLTATPENILTQAVNDPVFRSNPKLGAYLTATRTRNVPVLIGLKYILDDTDKDVLEDWEKTNIAYGARRFDYTHPLNKLLYECLLDSPIKYSINSKSGGTLWDVQLDIEFLRAV